MYETADRQESNAALTAREVGMSYETAIERARRDPLLVRLEFAGLAAMLREESP